MRKYVKWSLLFLKKTVGKSNKAVTRFCDIFIRKTERLKIQLHIYKTVEISVDDMLLKQSDYGEMLRCDMIVRLLAIEDYYGLNDYGFDLYKKMQDARIGEGYAQRAVLDFEELIKSYDENGYNKESGIIIDSEFNLIDGSHRMALALFHHIPYITANLVKSKHPVEYSIDWFFMNGFDSDEINHIVEKYKFVLEQVNKRFSCIIWAPAQKVVEDIISDLKIYGNVDGITRISLAQGEYDNIVRAVYSIDDIEKWKIEKKIEYMQGYEPAITCVDISFNDPDFRQKASTGLLISSKAERVKRAIREKYKNCIDNYFFDIILHIGDNIYQSNFMRNIFDYDFDFREIVNVLNTYNYAFVKVDVPYMPASFPDKIPVGKDADILCDEKDIDRIETEIDEIISKYSQYKIVSVKEEYGVRIRLQQGNTLFYQIDIFSRLDSDDDKFVINALDGRIFTTNGYYVLAPEYEFVYRAISLHKNPSKQYHREYLKDHIDDYKECIFNNYCNFRLDELIREK